MKTREQNPYISVTCVLFGFDLEDLQVLILGAKPALALGGAVKTLPGTLPGDLLYNDEDLDTCASRILMDVTGKVPTNCTQFGAFGEPIRMGANSKQRVVSIGYYSLIKLAAHDSVETDEASTARWVPLHSIEPLAAEDYTILMKAKESLRSVMHERPIAFELLPPRFTLGQVQKLYEAILDRDMDKRNFRRKILKLGILNELREKQEGVAHKPARYYALDPTAYAVLIERGFEYFKL